MANYSRIERKIWNSLTFKRLSEDGQRLWLYLLSCPHGNIIGLFVLKAGYVMEDLEWNRKRFDKVFSEVLTVPLSNGQGKGLVSYDEENKMILIKNFLEHNPITNPNQIKAAIKKVTDLPVSYLFQHLKVYIKGFNKDLYKDLCEVLGKPIAVTVAVTEEESLVGERIKVRDFKGEVDEVLSFLNGKIGKNYQRREEVEARLRDGGTVEECKQIIKTKLKDPYFQSNPGYYHPTTLFRKSHWDKYLNESPEDFEKEEKDGHEAFLKEHEKVG